MKMHLKLIVCKTEAILITVSNVNCARYCNGSVTCNAIACNLQLFFFWTWPTEFYGIYIYIYSCDRAKMHNIGGYDNNTKLSKLCENQNQWVMAAIAGFVVLVPCYVVKSLQLIWRLAPIDFIYGCPIFNWVAETWLEDSAPGKQSW